MAERGEADVFLEDSNPLQAEEDEEEEDEEEDARIFNAWMQRCRGNELPKKTEDKERSMSTLAPPVDVRTNRRASLPCPATLSAMQLSHLHSSTQAAVTAKVLLRRSSSRRLLPLQQQAATPVLIPEHPRRASLIPAIPEAVASERRGQFRRRNVMSMSDADSVCLICHDDLSRGTGGTRELQCTHTFHQECIEEWLWRKRSCPTCHVQVFMPQPVHWTSTRVKVP